MPKFETVFIHIGHGKTGSSYLQSALSLGSKQLAANGISYPLDDEMAERSNSGKITSGNYRPRPGALDKVISAGSATKLPNLLISGEAIFQELAASREGFLEELIRQSSGAKIKALLFLRDIVPHAVSQYQQRVKRGGYTGTLSESLSDYAFPRHTIRAIQRLKQHGCECTVVNYTRHADSVVAVAEKWLGLNEGTLPTPPAERINRSLTTAELEFQRALNATLGRYAAKIVSNPLCEEIPNLSSEWPPVNPLSLSAFLDRMKMELSDPDYISAVPEDERPAVLDFEECIRLFPEESVGTEYNFSSDQMLSISRAIGREVEKVEKLRKNAEKLRQVVVGLREKNAELLAKLGE
ncbi:MULTISPECIES: hypothetical protein [Rhodobacterales]|uniref:hypothetical protein n=1 Tax=Rhodobacterales TaxID=204455 RepID=UPI0011098DDD|nr:MULTISPECIES: hypothetical protein [Rhodobacterales]